VQRAHLVLLHGVDQILLVRKHKEWNTREALLLEKLLQLSSRLVDPPAIGAIDDVHKGVGLVEIIAPVGTDRLLTCGYGG